MILTTRGAPAGSGVVEGSFQRHRERFVRSIKTECLSRLIFLGEAHLRWAASTYVDYYNRVRNHQGMDNKLLTPQFLPADGEIRASNDLEHAQLLPPKSRLIPGSVG